ncbi:bifunctional folylpolyglutamate synthase/dihydrofolate synthase [Anaerobacillus sp. MEB173]|uniref:bifunctional folylpolyglutamate synthase/dihydrofolate synthase n=1 Tax=Anaerobacillus sp. MEB173 TaxID=3383345 RepID=UPI003F904E47
MKTYEEALQWVHGLLTFGIKPGLSRMEWMLERLGHPERRLKSIHVGGTNGKGSTVTFLRHMLEGAGYDVGTFTSPYIEHFNERISVNGLPIKEEDFLTVANKIRPLVEELAQTELGSPTEFEVITTIAFEYFATVAYPDVVIWEVGLGGRYDSTNVIHPLLSIITNVGYDHMNILGNTIEEIASQKAGIIKPGVPVITGSEKEEVLAVFRKEAIEKRSVLYELGKQFSYRNYSCTEDDQRFRFESVLGKQQDVVITMSGEHQVKNASLALMAITYLKTYCAFLVEDEHISTGLQKANWLGRFEKVSTSPTVILDGAHNPEGVKALAETLKQQYNDRNIYIIFCAMKDKEVSEMLTPLSQLAKEVIFTSFDFPRAATGQELFEQAKFENKRVEEDWGKAIATVKEKMREEDVLVVTGSLYFISEVRGLFVKKNL